MELFKGLVTFLWFLVLFILDLLDLLRTQLAQGFRRKTERTCGDEPHESKENEMIDTCSCENSHQQRRSSWGNSAKYSQNSSSYVSDSDGIKFSLINIHQGKLHRNQKSENKDKYKLNIDDSTVVLAVIRLDEKEEKNRDNRCQTKLNHARFLSMNFVNDQHQRVVSEEVCHIQNYIWCIDIKAKLVNNQGWTIVE